MALIDLLNSTINQYNDNDPAWRQFISDHKRYVLGLCRTYVISTAYMQGYTYSLRRYLRSINYDDHCAWIVALINDLPTDIGFTPAIVNSLQIPPMSVIQDIYTNYVTSKPVSA